MTIADELRATISQVVKQGKGILAADESLPTIASRFAQVNTEPTEENRHAYRALLFTTPGISRYCTRGRAEYQFPVRRHESRGVDRQSKCHE